MKNMPSSVPPHLSPNSKYQQYPHFFGFLPQIMQTRAEMQPRSVTGSPQVKESK
jgi:hypothetical protein